MEDEGIMMNPPRNTYMGAPVMQTTNIGWNNPMHEWSTPGSNTGKRAKGFNRQSMHIPPTVVYPATGIVNWPQTWDSPLSGHQYHQLGPVTELSVTFYYNILFLLFYEHFTARNIRM